MKKLLIVSAFIFLALSCTKEQPKTDNKNQDIPVGEFQALKKEVEDLKVAISTMTDGQEQGVSKSEFEALKQENEALRAQIELLTSTFFEVDGLRFNQNGEVVSTPKLADSEVVKGPYDIPYSVTRTHDAQGRLIECYESYEYGNYGYYSPPFLWNKVTYEFNGKVCRVTTQTHDFYGHVSNPPKEVVTETTYW